MARKVFVSSDMSIDEAVSEVAEKDPVAALIWPWILTYFDDWGRAKASSREIKNSVFPANELITTDLIGNAISLYGVRLVQLYEHEGKPYMCIDPDKWFKYQTHIRREKRENDGSKHPAPIAVINAQVRALARGNAQSADNLTDCIPSPSPSPSLSPSPSKDTTTTAAIDILEQAHKETAAAMDTVGKVNPFKLFETEGFGTISSTIGEKLGQMIDEFGERWTCEAMKVAVYRSKRSLGYVDGILKSFQSSGVDEPWNQPNIAQFPKGGKNYDKHGTGHAGRTDAELNALSL